MKKTLIASAIGLTLGFSATVQAQTITITSMKFPTAYGATGTMNSNGNGQMSSTENFNGFPWVADQQNWFDDHANVSTWSGTGTSLNTTNSIGNFTYTFQLSSNQVAAGTFFDWNSNINIPVLTIYDCGETGPSSCKGTSLGMAAGPFPGAMPIFKGTTNDDFPQSGPVPVPAAVWLMGSGLLGLVGVARRRKVV